MAISQNCLLTTPSLAVVTCSLFCPPQQCSLSSLGCGQRRLCQPRAVCPTPHSPTHSPTDTPQHTAGACLPACLHTFGAANLLKHLCWKRTCQLHRGMTATRWLTTWSIWETGKKVFLESQNAWEKCYPGLADPEVRMAATKLREWEQHQEKPTQIWTQEERSMKGFVVECLKVPQPNLKAS